MLKRTLWALSLCLLPLFAVAEGAAEWKAGEHYDVITPAERTTNTSKIEVAEFFWYGCGHCFKFEPVLRAWIKQQPEDVYFRGIPAMWGGPMELHAKAYYTGLALGESEKINDAMFNAMNIDRKPLKSEAEVAQVFAQQGIEEDKFVQMFNSFGVDSQVRQASAAARGAKITGTPAMMINGKYMISPRKAGSYENMLKIADFLIAQERGAAAPAAEQASL
ncbi:thiol:disulfide interchange protein DsbA/DsbL [Haliea sp. E17]|uniref:thiol:disulfide interchange protein DsbA/DsbL n=1 Tax=Haliea sp. E17 TaxID=3401576 RepID=UPI003AAD597C